MQNFIKNLHSFLIEYRQMFLVMRNTLFISLICAFQAVAGISYAQVTRISLDMKNSTVKEVLQKIEQNSEFYFLYNSELIDVQRKVDLAVNNEKIDVILSKLFQGEKVDVLVRDRHIVLTPVIEVAAQQQKALTGKVTDAGGVSLPGVSIVVKGTTQGVISDNNGNYSLANVPKNATLQFSFVGMKMQEIKVDNQTTINVVMEEEFIGVEEVVAIGYGTQQKKDITGSIASVSVGDMLKQPIQNSFQTLLGGRVAGLQISSLGGAPGARVDVNIRGSSSLSAGTDPLYVIDGVQTGGGSRDFNDGSQGASYLPRVNPLSLLNPQDIESIQVLKDASASAIYGARGANGVIIITTKRAKRNQETRVNLNSSYGIQTMSNRLDLMNGREHAQFLNEFFVSNGGVAPFSSAKIDSIGEGTDWQKETFRQAAVQSHQLSVTGSSGKTDYYISASVLDQKGIAINSGLKRYTFRSNIDQRLGEKFKLSGSFTYSRAINDGISDANYDYNYKTSLQRVFFTSPTMALKDKNGNYNRTYPGSINAENPVESLEVSTSNLVGDNLLGNISIDYNIINGLVFKTAVGVDLNNRTGKYYFPVLKTYLGSLKNGWGDITQRNQTTVIFDNILTYSRLIGGHSFSAMVGSTIQKADDYQFGVEVSNFPSQDININNATTASGTPIGSSGISQTSLVGFMGRLNYDYKSKYLLTASIRRDGSSVFADGNKWGNFPSFSLGWRVSEESFLKGVEAISELKIRAGYGVTGNQAIGPFQSLAAMVYRDQYIFNNTLYTGVTQTRLANKTLGWEETIQSNLGLDLDLWKNVLHLTFDYFEKKTNNMLFQVLLPANSGYSGGLFNTGSVKNKGVEITLGANLFSKREFNWNSEISFSQIRNNVTSLGNSSESYFGTVPGGISGGIKIMREGVPFGSFFGYKFDGVWHTQAELDAAAAKGFVTTGLLPGDAKYMDQNGDGRITADDRVIIGDPYPDFSVGFNNNLSYKNFSLNIFVKSEMGMDILNYPSNEINNPGYVATNKSKALVNRWTPSNTGSDIPRANFKNYLTPSSQLLEDGSYVKIQNIQLSYTLKKCPVWLKSAQVYISGQNLYTFTNYSGIDPGAIGLGGTDTGAYPTSTTYVLGINLGF